MKNCTDIKQSKFNDILAKDITLELTCEAYPEQYWAREGTDIVGYIRLRFGHLTCDYLPTGKLSEDNIRVIDARFSDELKGSFDSTKERNYWLDKCKEALLDIINLPKIDYEL